jgi:hypothetical protein
MNWWKKELDLKFQEITATELRERERQPLLTFNQAKVDKDIAKHEAKKKKRKEAEAESGAPASAAAAAAAGEEQPKPKKSRKN